MVGLTALSWLVLIPAVACWPVAGLVVYLVWRNAKHHHAADDAHREALLEAARAASEQAGQG